MNRLKPYPTHKDSGVPWLGKVPEHWQVSRVKWLFRYKKEINVNRSQTNILSLTLRGVVNNDPDNPEGLVPKDYGSYQIFQKDNLVFKLIDLENLRTSRVGLVHENGIMSPAYVRLVSQHNGIQRFFFLQYYDLYQRGIYNQLGAGVRSTLGPSDLLNVNILVPEPDEQTAIVRYLDYMERRIRRHINAKKKLIALLNEQKRAIVHQAVTRGLDPDVRLKPSGVELLGEVPENWEVRPAKHYYREVDERSEMGAEELLSVSHITGVTPRSQKNITMFMASSYAGQKLCKSGDLVINTMWAWMGALGVARQSGIVSPSYGVYRPLRGSRLLGDYADLLLRTRPYVAEYICCSTGIRSSRLRLYPDQFLRIKLTCPPVEEQRDIVRRVTVETEALDRAMVSTQREITLLSEYRTRLIADVVTGKLNVLEVAASLPDEAEGELAAFEEAESLSDNGTAVEDGEETITGATDEN